eukprot:Em0443g2a
MDGSTDSGNIDDELFLAVFCDVDGMDERVHTRMKFLAAIDAEESKRLVGIGTDGTNTNIASAGLKGLVESQVPWVFWMWCLAHRVELAIKDALKSTTFDLIDEMLLRMYYIYEKSPKKCRELENIITDLKEFMKFDDAGIRPVRASGTRWVTHKLSAMKRIISKFGAYTSHLVALSEDSSTKAADRAKFKGYLKKWLDAKYLLGCAFFVDLLLPCSVFSKTMQSDEVDIVEAMSNLLRTVKEVDKLSSCGLERLAWSDLQLIRDIIFVMETQGWQKILDDESEVGIVKKCPKHAEKQSRTTQSSYRP